MLMTRPRLVTWSRLLTWPSRSECLSYKSDDLRSSSGSLRTAQAGCHSLTHGSGNAFLCPNTCQHNMREFSCFTKNSFILVNAYLVCMVYAFVCSVCVCEHVQDSIRKCTHHGCAQKFPKVPFGVVPFRKPQSEVSVNKVECGHWIKVAHS